SRLTPPPMHTAYTHAKPPAGYSEQSSRYSTLPPLCTLITHEQSHPSVYLDLSILGPALFVEGGPLAGNPILREPG
ncbi:MAG: hypothetical protein OSA24_08370, partial [Longimicrobiales bacterium]|nr:hypothetical protein [Longimicrobiales bacterium]